MQSGVIDEILDVEDQAEKIIDDARQEAKKIVDDAHEKAARLVSTSIDAVKQDAGKGSDYIISSCEEAYRDEPDAEA